MAVELANKTNVDPPSGPYPFGNIKDETGLNDGTPVDKAVYADFHQFFAKLLYESFITPNNLPENATNGFQYFDAFRAVANQFKAVNSYSSNTSLTDDDLSSLSVMDVNGDADFTLPPLSIPGLHQKITLMKLGTGTCAVLPDGSDVIVPSENIYLKNGDIVTLASFGFGWIVINRSRRAKYPLNLVSGGVLNLTEKDLETMIVLSYAGNTTVNLPALAAGYDGQSIVIQKEQGGTATIVPNGVDQIYPNTPITLVDGDTLTLVNIGGIYWIPLNRYNALENTYGIITQTSNTNGVPTSVVAISGTFVAATETYYYTWYRYKGLIFIHFKAVYTMTSGAIVTEIRIPLPQNIVKDTGITENFSFKGTASFKSPGGTSDYAMLQARSNGSGAEGQTIVIRRITEGDTQLTWSAVNTTIEGEITIKEA